MVVGIGVDIVQTSRIEGALERFHDRFLHRVFTEQEQAVCSQTNDVSRLAARFAAKEAVMKALGTGRAHGKRWIDVEIVGHGGPPRVLLHGQARILAEDLGIDNIHLSLSHEREYAIAFVVATTSL